MRRETVIPAPIRGAARTLDMAYPAPLPQAVSNNAIGLTWINRQGFATFTMGTTSTFGAQPPGSGWFEYRGRMAFKTNGSGTSGSYYISGGNFAIYFPTTQLDAAYNDDFACWRVVAILAFDPGLGAGDTGIEIGAAANYDVITGNAPGFRFGPAGPNSAAFQVRQNGGGPLTVNQAIAPVGMSTQDYNAYEIRFIGATPQRDAVVKAFFNGVQYGAFNYGAGSLMPGLANGTTLGWQMCVGNRGADATYTPVCGVQVSAAANEPGLL